MTLHVQGAESTTDKENWENIMAPSQLAEYLQEVLESLSEVLKNDQLGPCIQVDDQPH